MRELSASETAAVGGGFAPVLVAIGIALLSGGCATTGGLRKGEEPPE